MRKVDLMRFGKHIILRRVMSHGSAPDDGVVEKTMHIKDHRDISERMDGTIIWRGACMDWNDARRLQVDKCE